MYVGHVGAALAGKRAAPAATLASLLVASYLPDWADAAFCVAGKYQIGQLYSHSLPAVAVLALVAGGLQLARGRARLVAAVVALLVVSHLLLDFVTGRKYAWRDGPRIGLGLYSHPALEFFIEAGVIVIGWLLYRATLPPNRKSWNDSHLMLGLLLLMQLSMDIAKLLQPAINKC